MGYSVVPTNMLIADHGKGVSAAAIIRNEPYFRNKGQYLLKNFRPK